MKKIAALALLILALPSLGAASDCLSSSDSSGAPSIPHDFRGNITINGDPAPQGTEVSAYIDGEKVSVQTAVSEGTYANQEDRFVVCGGGSGDTITFRTGNEKVGESTYYSGNSTEKDLSGSDNENPTASFSAPSTVNTGESVELDASSSSDDTQILSYSWSVSGAEGEKPSISFSSTGEKTVQLTVTDLVGNTDTVTQNIQVTSESTGGGGGSGGGGSFSGGVPTGSSPTNSSEEVQITIDQENDTVTAEVENLDNRSKVDIDLNISNENSVKLEKLSLPTSREDENFTVEIIDLGINSPVETKSSSSGLHYYQIDVSSDNAGKKSIETTFTQLKEHLEKNSIYPSEVVVKRFSDGTWQEISTTLVGETEDRYRFQASVPESSYIAITSSGAADKEACTENCSKTQKERAQEAIEEANKTVSKGMEGYQTLERALESYRSGDYSRAEILAEEAQKMSSVTNDNIGNIPVVPVLAVAALLTALALIFMKKEYLLGLISGDGKEKEIAQRLNEIANLLKSHHYDQRTKREVGVKITEAEQALENDELDQAERILEELEKELESSQMDFSID